MPVRPVSPDQLVTELADRVASGTERWTRVLLDGPTAAAPQQWADALVDPLHVRGRPVLRVSLWDFLRPASLRFERGRQNPDSFVDDWFDLGALVREVLSPLTQDGDGRVLPRWWDATIDRSARADYVTVAEGGVLLVDGPFLLGHDLPAELAIHLHLSHGALRRRTPRDEAWTLPAYDRYDHQNAPARVADVVAFLDHPDRPAMQTA